MKLRIVTNPSNGFWKSFDALSHYCFHHSVQFKSAWLKPYINNLLKGRIYIIAVYKEKELVGCLPLEERKQRATRLWSYRVLHILGSGPTDFFEILAQPEKRKEILSLIFSHLRERMKWDYLHLNLLPQSGETSNLIKKIYLNKSFNITKTETTGYRYENTLGTWEIFNADIFEGKNKDLGKGERRLRRDNINFSIESFKENVFEQFIATLDLYASRRETLGQFNLYEDENYRMFLKNVCENYERFHGIEFNVMKDSSKNIEMAIQLDFINKNTRYHWNHAFNDKYKRYSPGKILLKEILKKSFADPDVFSCNHMRGLSNYKKSLTSYQEMMTSYRIERLDSSRIKATRLASKIIRLFR